MILVDTNILAYLLLEGPQSTAATALLERDKDWHSESFILPELANVLVTTMRIRGLSLARALTAFADGRRVIERGLHTAADEDVLTLADRFGITAYDARFLALAQTLGARLVTEDAKLRKAVPRLTQSLAEALAD